MSIIVVIHSIPSVLVCMACPWHGQTETTYLVAGFIVVISLKNCFSSKDGVAGVSATLSPF